ncbi:MAG: homocysteine S-methyltransferase family protein [Planctomycetaceae bacterium]|nr:homocysteine S-methyltransferase family protein [Planctomycetaceae bacterium]
MPGLIHRLTQPEPLLFDGATGTELQRRGFPLAGPAWSAAAILEAPDLLRQIHADYVAAGADILTANTFRTHSRNLREAGLDKRAAELTYRAVDLARAAAAEGTLVAGSIAPLEDCYAPDRTPDTSALIAEHQEHAENLRAAGADLLLVETQITIREAVAATAAALSTGLPVLTSFTLQHGLPGTSPSLLSGESLQQAANQVIKVGALGILLNCIPADEILPALRQIGCSPAIPLGAYANTGRMLPDGTWASTTAENPAVYAEHATAWKAAEIRWIGGCCGTTPRHISAVRKALYG